MCCKLLTQVREQAIVSPLLSALQEALQVQMIGPQDVLPVLKVHHLIRALGNISKGFPDAPVPTPADFAAPPWVSVFEGVADAILVSLSRMGGFKIIREAVSFSLQAQHPYFDANGPSDELLIRHDLPSRESSPLRAQQSLASYQH